MTGRFSDEEMLERLIIIQRRMGEEPEDVLTSIAEVLENLYMTRDIPPVRFTLLACILLGQERGLRFVRTKIPEHAYNSIFPTGLPSLTC